MNTTKQCYICNNVYPLNEDVSLSGFYKARLSKDKFQNACKNCDKRRTRFRANRVKVGGTLINVDIEKVHKRLLNVLERDVRALLKESAEGKLNKDSSASLNNYLKLIKDLKKEEDALLAEMVKKDLNE